MSLEEYRKAIDAIARHRGEAFDQRFTGQPVGEEGANHRTM